MTQYVLPEFVYAVRDFPIAQMKKFTCLKPTEMI